jgi:hypothetical protein
LWWLLTFVQMSTVAIALAVDRLGASARLWRWLAVATLVMIVAVSTWQSGALEAGLTMTERLSVFASGPVIGAVASPFAAFSRLMTAQTWTSLAVWGAAVLALNLLVVVLILRLDANFLEASLTASQKRYELIERAVRSGGMPTLTTGGKARFTLPAFPRLFGAGPVARRQLLHLVRGSGRLVFVVPAMIGPLVPIIFLRQGPIPNAVPVVFMTLFIGFLVSSMLPLGLRSDLDHVDTIKTLPIANAAIVWGSIASAVIYPTMVQLIAAGTVTVLAPQWIGAAAAAIAFAVPMNLLLVGADSILVLLFPTIRRFAPGDMLLGARMMLVMMVKFVFLMVAAGVAGAIAFLAYTLAGEHLVAAGIAAWVVLLVEGIGTVAIASLMFARFDPSSDTSERE